jgi:hypothetical protein
VRRCEDDGLVYYRFEGLAALGLNHAVFTRHGGASRGPFESLNLSLGVGDDPERVRVNRQRAAAALGLSSLASARQVHGTGSLLVEGQPQDGGSEPHGADILLTERPGVGLMIKQADCQAVIIVEPERRALALVHCGWRGSVANALGEAVARLVAAFGARPELMRAAIAPSLGPCCAEFRGWREELPATFAAFRVRDAHFDFWRLSLWQLTQAGLAPENVEVSGICTRCSAEFYSYRREGLTGRFATVGSL